MQKQPSKKQHQPSLIIQNHLAFSKNKNGVNEAHRIARAVDITKMILKIEKKHEDFFNEVNFNGRHCIKIVLDDPPSAHIKDIELPWDIRQDIEEMFWVE